MINHVFNVGLHRIDKPRFHFRSATVRSARVEKEREVKNKQEAWGSQASCLATTILFLKLYLTVN